MADLVLICDNCGNQFVFSEGEQEFYKSKGLKQPYLCPICRSIKHQENLRPAKPSKL